MVLSRNILLIRSGTIPDQYALKMSADRGALCDLCGLSVYEEHLLSRVRIGTAAYLCYNDASNWAQAAESTVRWPGSRNEKEGKRDEHEKSDQTLE